MFLEHALAYARLGWRVFRLTGYKTPFKGSHGFKDATVDENVIRSWWSAVGGWTANIGLATGFDESAAGGRGGPNIVVVDCDGESALQELKAVFGGVIPRTLTAKTSKGWHFYFTVPAGMRLKSFNAPRAASGDPGIDVKADKAYVVLPPSINAKSGFVYYWVNWGCPIAECDGRLLAWHVARRGARKAGPPPDSLTASDGLAGLCTSPGGTTQTDHHAHPIIKSGLAQRALNTLRRGELPDFVAALRRINAACGYDEWFRIGAACYDFDPGELGLGIFKRWSCTPACGGERYQEDVSAGVCEAKWAEYALPKQPGDPTVSVATIYYLAGKSLPPPMEDQTTTASSIRSGGSPSSMHGAGGGINGHSHLPSIFTQAPQSPGEAPITLDGLNERFATVGDMGGKCVVMGWVPSKVDDGVQVPSFQTFKSFSERFAHKYVIVKTIKPDGSVVEEAKQAGGHWLKWPSRKSFEGIDLAPGEGKVLPGNVLNLWRGFAVEPSAEGGWTLMQTHIRDVLAGGDPPAADYIFRFAAWAVQHPGERAEAALVFRGEKGTGKGTFANALRRIFGQHGLQIFNSKHLVGAFNGHLRSCLLLFSDEAFWAGDKQGESVLKGLLTEPAFMIEQKGVDATPWKNRLHVIMSANAEWVVPATHDERRYTVFDVSSRYRDNAEYFRALHQEIVTGGLAAMLHDLLELELGAWHPRQIVRTEALRQQKIRSMAPIDEWWEGVLQSARYPVPRFAKPGDAPTRIVPAIDLYERAKNTTPRLRDVSIQLFGRYLKKAGCEGFHQRNGNSWEFPTLEMGRNLFEARFGKWVWENAAAEWGENK